MVPFMIALFVAFQGFAGLQTPVEPTQIQQVVPKLLSITPVSKTESSVKIPKTISVVKNIIPDVPFFSQFKDIDAQEWKKVGCGIASLAMIIDYYKPDTVSVNTLLKQGIKNGAYLKNAGWTYSGLIALANKYSLDGESYDLGKIDSKTAFAQFEEKLKKGPVIASIHYKFDPKSTIPHLVVINGIKDDVIYYNDPAADVGGKTISVKKFLGGWKKRFIVLHQVASV